MVRRKHRKLRAAGRWGVWVCTVLLSFLICISNYQELNFQYSNSFISDGSVVVRRNRVLLVCIVPLKSEQQPLPPPVSPLPNGSIRMDCIPIPMPSPVIQVASWWMIPQWDVTLGGTTKRITIDLPLVYLSAILIAWSLWCFKEQRIVQLRVGCCIGCGYSLAGLESDVCPECGEAYEA